MSDKGWIINGNKYDFKIKQKEIYYIYYRNKNCKGKDWTYGSSFLSYEAAKDTIEQIIGFENFYDLDSVFGKEE